MGRPSGVWGMTSAVEIPPAAFAKPDERAPLPWRLEMTPYGTRGSADSGSILRTSPGRAPSTYTGPVTTCGPSASKLRGCREYCFAMATASCSTFSRPTPLLPNHATGSRPWSSRRPSWLTVSMVIVRPERTRATAVSDVRGR